METKDNFKMSDISALKELIAPIFSAMERKDEQISESFRAINAMIEVLNSKDEQINRLISLVENQVHRPKGDAPDDKTTADVAV